MSDFERESGFCAGCSAWGKTGVHSTSCLYTLITRLESGESPRSRILEDARPRPTPPRSWWGRLVKWWRCD